MTNCSFILSEEVLYSCDRYALLSLIIKLLVNIDTYSLYKNIFRNLHILK